MENFLYMLLRRVVSVGVLSPLVLSLSVVTMSAIPADAKPKHEVDSADNSTSVKPSNNFDAVVAKLKSSKQKWVEIRLRSQRLIAWQGDRPVRAVIVSTGKLATSTPTGEFTIQSKHRIARMQGDDYDIDDVPYTMYYSGNYAIHGAYWHNNFGIPVSHGCINVAEDHARWLFDWASVGTTSVVVRQ